MIKPITRYLLPLVVLLVCFAVAKKIMEAKPAIKKKKSSQPNKVVVDVLVAKRQNFQRQIVSQGVVKPRVDSTLISQVSGKIIYLSPLFRKGQAFKKNQRLLQIDPKDYEFAVTIAKAELSKAYLALAEEQAKSDQALKNWQNLGSTRKPSDLVLRKPHLLVAQATVDASKARLQQAQLTLKRSWVYAPYAGRILKQSVDLGQYVTPNSVLAKIFSLKTLEVRLPLSFEELKALGIEKNNAIEKKIKVLFTSENHAQIDSENLAQWQGWLLRQEAKVDELTQQTFVVASIDKTANVGQFVSARLQGIMLENVFVLPRSVLSGGQKVTLVNSDNDLQGQLQSLSVEVIWQTKQHVIVDKGIKEGQKISLTTVYNGVDGTVVDIKQ
jgi:RND family efflux transporter MFP subunit